MYAALFPGQGAQKMGMADALIGTEAEQLLWAASEMVGQDLVELCQEGPEERLQDTEISQPLIFAISYGIWSLKKATYGQPVCFLGHSLGEVTAMAAAEAFSFADGVQLAKRRASLMKAAYPENGGMLAVLGLEADVLQTVARECRHRGWIEAANFNGPGQIVLSGERTALEMAASKASEAGARRCIMLDVSGPFHSKLMQPAAAELATWLQQMDIADPNRPVISNTSGRPLSDAAQLQQELSEQLTAPVHWSTSIETAVALGANELVEFSPHPVTSTFSKRIVKGIRANLA